MKRKYLILILVPLIILLLHRALFAQSDLFHFINSYLDILRKYSEITDKDYDEKLDISLNSLDVHGEWQEEAKRSLTTSFRLLKESSSSPISKKIIAEKKIASLQAIEHSIMYLTKTLYSESASRDTIRHKLTKKERARLIPKIYDLSNVRVFREYAPINNALKFLIDFLSLPDQDRGRRSAPVHTE